MHTDFADWYRVAFPDLANVKLDLRWSSVEAFAKDASIEDILDTARLYHGLRPHASDFEQRFRMSFKQKDDTFAMRENSVELQVLAGTVLVKHFGYEDKWAIICAHAIICPTMLGERPTLVGGIEVLARESLAERSANVRQKAIPPGPKDPKGFAKKLKEETDALDAILDKGGAINTIKPQLNALLSSIGGAMTELQHWSAAVSSELELRREESDVLWWVFGEHSRDLLTSFHSVSHQATPLLAGKELADLSGSPGGPYSSRAFLHKVVNLRKRNSPRPLTLASAIDGCPPDWRDETARNTGDLGPLTPCLFALGKAAETGGKKGWKEAFENGTDLNPNREIDAVDFAEQILRECLLANAVGLESAES